MSLLETALSHAARGWFVFPCKPGDKYPITKHGWHDASRDAEQIRQWWAKTPNANVGIACGMSGLCVLDIDTGLEDDNAAMLWLGAHNMPTTYMVRSGRRPGFGLQVYFTGAIPDVIGWELDGCKGDIKSLGGLVMSAGCVHPSGTEYAVKCGSPEELADTPDWVRSLKSPNIGTGKDAAPVEGGRNNYLTSVAGKMRNAGLGGAALEMALLQHNADVCAPPLPEDEVKAIAAHVLKYDVPEPDPVAVIGKPLVEVAEDADDAVIVNQSRPVYPDGAWAGTAYAEFAELCTRDNPVPPKFYIESLRTAVGAVMGDRLRCPLDAVNPRAYTIFIAPPQKGKGTSISRVQELFKERWDSLVRTELPLLFTDTKSLWKQRGIGAQIINPASAPGLMMALAPPQPKKAVEGETPAATWVPIPRLLTMMEEVRGLFANFTLESTGAGLEGVLCELFDRTSFSATATAKRAPQSGEAMLSILGGITGEEWEKIFSQTSSAGSGFLSRLNLIGTEGNYPRASAIDVPDFTEFRRTFFPRLLALEAKPMTIKPTPAAKNLVGEWLGGLDLGSSARINLHAWRTALHIAWLHDSEFITEEHIRRGIQVADYQLKMRDYYMAAEGESRQARCEAHIRKVARRGTIRLSALKYQTNYTRYGVGFWTKCLAELVKNDEVRIDKTAGNVRVIPLKAKD